MAFCLTMKKYFILLIFVIFCFFIKDTFALEKININIATLEQLDQITSVGKVTAQKIIDSRPFLSLNDLLKVKGIGEATLQKIKDQGLACVDCIPVIPSLTGNPVTNIENSQDTLDSRLRGNDTSDVPVVSIIYPSGIIFNEILPSPEGPDEQNEFIELYNTNNFDVDLSEWKIMDKEGTSTTFTILKDTKILANNFLIFKRPQTKISLNNTSDTLNLFLPNDKIIDSVSFPKAITNQSYNKTGFGWAWSSTITPNSKNIISQPTATKTNNNSTDNLKLIDENLASLNNSLDSSPSPIKNNFLSNNPIILFLIVLIVAIILAVVVFIIKLKLSKKQ
ncbi:MAG: hypothetical protein UR22_C0008G0037 [Parcubacteria group bacterium GW2011_GWC2_32_10]|nr:MAG: hypothetical protein UR22_C0008G0037 [Parcubacteria group bacterium GW2011_GWC2_32_10]